MSLLFIFVLSGCSPLAELEARRARLESEIDALIGDASCTDADACASVAMGDKACGGPERYLVYCTESVDITEIEALAEEHREVQSQINEIEELGSDCAYIEAPETALEGGVCVAQ